MGALQEMNARFAESSREEHLDVEGQEFKIERNSVVDGRTPKQLRLDCAKDIHIGFCLVRGDQCRRRRGWNQW